MVVGFLAYGVSLTLFVISLRHLGTARAGAYFSVAPFFGAALAVATGESLTTPLLIAGGLMMMGLWLHLTERHEHYHAHEALEHEHDIFPDEHHQHLFNLPSVPMESNRHKHHEFTTSIRISQIVIIGTFIEVYSVFVDRAAADAAKLKSISPRS